MEAQDLRELLLHLTPEQIEEVAYDLSPAQAEALLQEVGAMNRAEADSPTTLGTMLYENYIVRSHLAHLSSVIARAVADVEAGLNRTLIVELPPRSGKTTTTTLLTPAWLLSRHPSWPIALTSHDGGLASSWGRQIRRWAESGALGPEVAIARDAGAVGAWETTEGGRLLSLSIRESFTGRGAKVLIIDDPHKDFVDAHSATMRTNVWEWWLSVAQTRLEPPYLVIVVMTRWHEDDLVGRLLSPDYPGDPASWEVVSLPALATSPNDALGRGKDEPLLSPLIEEDAEQALERWQDVKRSVGSYVWSSMYQQSPAPSKGAIFDASWWRFWTSDPQKETEDGRVVYLDPSTLAGARWVDSWDAAFKSTSSSDYVVGQRWARQGPKRYLIDQVRSRLSFTQTLTQMETWLTEPHPYAQWVHQVLVEEKANGAAILDVLKDKFSGLKAINPDKSKEARARAITPECESGHVYLPHPSDPGKEWVTDLLSELRNFPFDAHDDQVDSLTQALSELRDEGSGAIAVPGRGGAVISRNLTRAARTGMRRPSSGLRRLG